MQALFSLFSTYTENLPSPGTPTFFFFFFCVNFSLNYLSPFVTHLSRGAQWESCVVTSARCCYSSTRWRGGGEEKKKLGGKIYTRGCLTAVHRAKLSSPCCALEPPPLECWIAWRGGSPGYGILFREIFVSSERSSLSKLAARATKLSRAMVFSPIPSLPPRI